MQLETVQDYLNKPFATFGELHNEAINRGLITEDIIPIQLKTYLFTAFLKDSKIISPNENGDYTDIKKHYTLNNYKLHILKQEIQAKEKKQIQDNINAELLKGVVTDTTTSPQKKIKKSKTPNITTTAITDNLFNKLKKRTLIECAKVEYNKLFNGAEIGTFNLKWNGSVGLLKELFNKLSVKLNIKDKLYYRACFDRTQKQFNNNKVSEKDKKTAKELLS